jgi:hypothetical protein
LHQQEIAWINANAEKYAKLHPGMTTQEAKEILAKQGMRDTDTVWAGIYDENKDAQAFIEQNSDGTLFHATQAEKDNFMQNIETFSKNTDFYSDVKKSPTILGIPIGTTDATKVAKLEIISQIAHGNSATEGTKALLNMAREAYSKGDKEKGREYLDALASAYSLGGNQAVGSLIDLAKNADDPAGTAAEVLLGGMAGRAAVKGISRTDKGKVRVTLDDGSTAVVPESVAYDNKGIYDSKAVKEYLEGKYGAQNVAKHSVDETTGRNVVETNAGEKGGWNKFINKDLEPNSDYKVGDTLYKTDEHGRVQEVHYEVKNQTADRNEYQQSKAGETGGYKDALENDEGGHLQASAHGGAGEQINLLPQDKVLNRSEWKQMENSWTKAVNEGKKVEVKIKPVYEGSSKRPSEYRVKYTIDGEDFYENIPNGGGK